MKKKTINRVLSMIVVLTLLLGILPVNTWAVDHVHDETCGYAEPSECTHAHDDSCGYVAAVEGVDCGHSHDAACGYSEGSAGIPCGHVHGDCGYAEASPCTFTPCDHSSCGYVAGSPCNGLEGCDHLETDNCGYVEGVECPNAGQTCDHSTCGYTEGNPCNHTEHIGCGYAAEVPGTACNHSHDGTCGYVEAASGNPCIHTHDDVCWYSEGSACNYAVAPIDDTEHTCSYDNSYQSNGNGHWQVCISEGCYLSSSIAEHINVNDDNTCDTCGYVLYTEGGTTYTVTYTDGVEDAVIFADVTHTVAAGETVPTYVPPEREGFFFDGWSPNYTTTVTADTTFTAIWRENTVTGFTVTYTDGVADVVVFSDQVYDNISAGNATPSFEGSLTREGFTFAGWSPAVAETVMGDATYTAQWTADEPDTPEPLTISVSHAYLIGGGTITITTSKPADQVTADFEDGLEDGLIKITTNNKINWTATIPDHILGRTYFIATDENGSVESAEVNFSPTFWINPTSETLTGGGTVTLVTAVPVSSVTCDAGGINVQGSGDEWTATLPNRTATYTFTATLDNYTASCTVSVTYSATGSSGSSDDSDDDDDYTPSDDAGNESGNNTQPQPETPPADESGYVWQQQDPLDTVYTVPVTGEQTVQVTADVTEDEDGRVQVSILPLTPEQLAVLGDAPTVIIDLTGVEDTGSIEAAIPGKAVQDISEGTQGDVQLKTPIADVIIGHDAIAENAGELVMEARRTEDGISTKVSIGGVSVIDTGVKLPAGVTLPEDGKLVVGTLQPGVNALNFLPLTETTEPSTRMAMVPEDTIKSTDAAVIGPDGGSYTQHERLLIHGKEYYVSGSGDGGSLLLYDKEGNIYSYDGEKDPQEIGQNAGTEYPENEFISINGAVYQIHSVQRDTDGNGTLILYLDGKPAGMCQFDQYEEMNSINIYNKDYAPDKVKERQQNSNQLGTVTPGETPIDGLETGKTYNVSVIGSQDISVPGYDEAVLNSIKAETEAEKAAREKVERLKADMEAKEAAMDQLWRETGHLDYWYAVIASEDAEAAYEAALAELAALANLQSATVTQTFDIPNELVGRTDVTFAAVHNTNPFPVPGSSIRDDIANFKEEWHKQWEETYSPEIGTVEVSEDGQTLTATYTVSSFSPFTIYAFVEADEPEIKTITTLNIPDESTPQAPAPAAEDAPGNPIFLWITLMSLTAIALLAVVIVVRKRSRR